MDPIIAVANDLLAAAKHLDSVAGIRAEVFGAERIEFSQGDDEQRRWARRLRDMAGRMIQERTAAERFGPELTVLTPLRLPEIAVIEDEELPF